MLWKRMIAIRAARMGFARRGPLIVDRCTRGITMTHGKIPMSDCDTLSQLGQFWDTFWDSKMQMKSGA
jgi:hypothetical protein